MEYEAQSVARCLQEKDPQKQAALALMVKDKALRDALLAKVAQKNQDAPNLQSLAFMARHLMGEEPSSDEKDSDQFRKDLAEAVQREPDNGALLLLEVEQREGVEVQVEGQPDPGWQDVPLTDAEDELLHRAANAPGFSTYRTFEQAYRQSYVMDNLGGLAGLAWPEQVEPYRHWQNTLKRALAAMGSLADKGEQERVVRLYEDGLILAARIEEEAPDDALGALTADSWRQSFCSVLYRYAIRAGDQKLLGRSIAIWSQAIERNQAHELAAHEVALLEAGSVPLTSLVAAELQVESPRVLATLYDRLLREKHAEYLRTALSRFAEIKKLEEQLRASRFPVPPDTHQYEFARMAALLGALGDPAGVPVLGELASSDQPLVSHIARAALEKFKAGRQPAKKA